jgi:phosphoglycerate dehydrogenase-like enzyme
MGRLLIASQFNEAFNETVAHSAPGLEILRLPPGPPASLPREVEILLAAPFRKAGGELPMAAPAGWPFDLRWIQLISVGIDFYPTWMFDGPVVTCARGASSVALAEFALAAILAAAKRLPEIWIDDAARWAPSQLGMVEGQTLGLVGFGSIGEALAPRARALGMNVVAVRRSKRPISAVGVERAANVETVFAVSDHVVLAAPATPETDRLVNRALLAKAKPGLHLINVARGALVDDAALLEALDEGRVSLATLDVTHPEPLPGGHPFYRHPKVRLSPHTSVHTAQTRVNLATQFADNLKRFRSRAPLRDVVDLARGY